MISSEIHEKTEKATKYWNYSGEISPLQVQKEKR